MNIEQICAAITESHANRDWHDLEHYARLAIAKIEKMKHITPHGIDPHDWHVDRMRGGELPEHFCPKCNSLFYGRKDRTTCRYCFNKTETEMEK